MYTCIYYIHAHTCIHYTHAHACIYYTYAYTYIFHTLTCIYHILAHLHIPHTHICERVHIALQTPQMSSENKNLSSFPTPGSTRQPTLNLLLYFCRRGSAHCTDHLNHASPAFVKGRQSLKLFRNSFHGFKPEYNASGLGTHCSPLEPSSWNWRVEPWWRLIYFQFCNCTALRVRAHDLLQSVK